MKSINSSLSQATVLVVVATLSPPALSVDLSIPQAAETNEPAQSEVLGAVGDERVREAVRAKLTGDPDVDVHDLMIEVQDGIVTLYGTVDASAEKHLASRYADDIPGVKGVVNGIDVVPALDRGSVPTGPQR